MTSCPANTVDEHAARVVAAMVVILAIVSVATAEWFVMVLLALDFVVRGFVDRHYSPLRFVAKNITAAAGWQSRPVYAPPKRFAAQVGAAVTTLATVFHAGGFHNAAAVTTALLIVAASLEAAFGFCLACWIYPYIHGLRTDRRT